METPDPQLIEDLVFRCLEAANPETELDAIANEHPHLESTIREVVAGMSRRGLAIEPKDHGVRLPEKLGTFRLEDKLGEGGMGVVYRAFDEELHRTVALKLVRPDLVIFESSHRRFTNEVEAVARLRHPGIVPIYRVGEQDGIRYFAMEFVAGITLGQGLDRVRHRRVEELTGQNLLDDPEPAVPSTNLARLSAAGWIEACLRIVRDVARGLAHAHEQGVLHRDVKPGNIMIDAQGHGRILDFGLARANDHQTMTRSGSAVGSLPYMSPEQVIGDRAAIDETSDIYALGVVLREALTLRHPFLDPEDPARTREAILRGTTRPIRRENLAVSRDVAALCRRAMARRPADRYPSMEALVSDLDLVLAKRPLPTGSPIGRLALAWPRTVASIAILGLVSFGFLLMAVLGGRGDYGTRFEEQITKARWQSYRASLVAAQKAIDDLDMLLARELLAGAPEEFRGWEWSMLSQRLEPIQPALKVNGQVWRTQSSPDGTHVLIEENDRSLLVWNRSTNAIESRIPIRWSFGHVFSDDARVSAYRDAADDRVVHLLDIETRAQREIRLPTLVTGLALNSDGSLLAAGLATGECALLELPSATERCRLRGPTEEFHWFTLEFDRSGRRLFGHSKDGSVNCWSVDDGQVVWRVPGIKSKDPALSASESWIATRPSPELVQVWSADDGSPIASLATRGVRRIAADPDDDHLWLSCARGVLQCLNVRTGQQVAEYWIDTARPTAFASQRRELLIGDDQGRVWLLPLAELHSAWITSSPNYLASVAIHADGSTLLYSPTHRPILSNPNGETSLLPLPELRSAAFVDADKIVGLTEARRELVVLDRGAGDRVQHLGGSELRLRTLAAVDSQRFVMASEDHRIYLHDLAVGSNRVLADTGRSISVVAPSPNRDLIATGGWDHGSIQVWDSEGRAILQTGDATADATHALAWSPDGRWLAVGSETELRMFDVPRRELAHRVVAPFERIRGLAFTSDGRRLAEVSGVDNSLRIWDVATWDRVASLDRHRRMLTAVVRLPRDGRLVTVDEEGTALFWGLTTRR